MAKTILTNCRGFIGGLDVTGNSNKFEISPEIEEKETTNFASGGWKELLGGLASCEIDAEGFWEAGDATKVDDGSWAQLGQIVPWTTGPVGAAVGNLAYFTQTLRADLAAGGQVGDVAPWKGKGKGSWPLLRGQIAHPPGIARTATGVGTGIQLGAVTAAQGLYANLHVLSVAGTAAPTITARVESSVDNTFAAPVTRLTFAAATAVGGQSLRIPGAVTDTWWRVAWTITGTTPSFLFAAALGIL